MDYRTLASNIARQYNIPVDLFSRLINQESGWRPDAVSPAGAIGFGQLMPGTAADLGVDPYDPEQNLRGAASYLRQQLDAFGSPELALAAYNAGPGNVRRYGGIPPFEETQNYVRAILGGSSTPVQISTSGVNNMPMNPQQPQGLLGALGIQKQDPTAAGETALPFYQRDRFKDTMGNLAVALNEMRLQPSSSIPQLIEGQRARRQQSATTNRTVEWLRSQPNGEQYAQMIETGAIPAANAVQAWQQAQASAAALARGEIKEVDGRLVRVMPDGTVQEIYGGGPDQEAIMNARKEFTSLQPVKDFSNVSFAYSRVMRSAEDPSPAGDLALIFNYMKILDPGSVVREGEFATAQNAGGIDTRVRSLYNSVISGERLTPEQRADFADRATRLYSGAQDQYNALALQYSDFARQAGLPVEQVIPDFGYSGELYEKPLAYQRPAAPQGITEAEWVTAWQNMTDQERAAFLRDMAND